MNAFSPDTIRAETITITGDGGDEIEAYLATPLADGSSLLVGDERRRSDTILTGADGLRLGGRRHVGEGDDWGTVAERAVPGPY